MLFSNEFRKSVLSVVRESNTVPNKHLGLHRQLCPAPTTSAPPSHFNEVAANRPSLEIIYPRKQTDNVRTETTWPKQRFTLTNNSIRDVDRWPANYRRKWTQTQRYKLTRYRRVSFMCCTWTGRKLETNVNLIRVRVGVNSTDKQVVLEPKKFELSIRGTRGVGINFWNFRGVNWKMKLWFRRELMDLWCKKYWTCTVCYGGTCVLW